MATLRYSSAGSDRLWDAIEERYFTTEKRAVENLNAKLERAAEMVEGGSGDAGAYIETESDLTSNLAERIRALKENV